MCNKCITYTVYILILRYNLQNMRYNAEELGLIGCAIIKRGEQMMNISVFHFHRGLDLPRWLDEVAEKARFFFKPLSLVN